MGERFQTRLGLLAATVGSAVGLGNIWRFPYMVGTSGSATFLLIYLVAVFLIGFPLLLAELSVGRAARKDVYDAVVQFTDKKIFHLGPDISLLLTFVVLSFYSVVGGWIIFYLFSNLTGMIPYSQIPLEEAPSHFQGFFQDFVSNPFNVIFFHALFLLCTLAITARGVQKGIERFSLYGMGIFYVLLLIFTIYSFTLGSWGETLRFLFAWDPAKLTPQVMLMALGHAFFTLSVGFGVMVTFGSYASDKLSLPTQAWWIVVADTVTALIVGMMIFNVVFHYGLPPGGGPNLLMVSMSTAFSYMPFGHVVGGVFFFLILLAALSSSISLLESLTAYAIYKWKLSRLKAVWIISLSAFLLGLPSALSETRHAIYLGGVEFFHFLQEFSNLVTVPALLFSIFVGWFLDKTILTQELQTKGSLHPSLKKWGFRGFFIAIRYVVPTLIIVVLLSELISLL